MFSLFQMKSNVDGKTLSPDNQDLLVRVGASLGWDTRDSWVNPRRGWQNQLEVWKTGGGLGGDGDFWSVILDVRRWQPTRRRQKLLLSGLMSFQSGVVGVDIPEYLQYRLGGANSLRGHDIEKLGRTLFGRNQMLGTVEYAYTVLRPRRVDVWKLSLRMALELAAFADVGTAWNESRELSMNRTRGGRRGGCALADAVLPSVRRGLEPGGRLSVPFFFGRAETAAPARPAALAGNRRCAWDGLP